MDPTTASATSVNYLVLALVVLSPIASVVISVVFGILANRRRPPLSEELPQRYVSKEELRLVQSDLPERYATKDDLRGAVDAMAARVEAERANRARLYEKIEDLRKEITVETTAIRTEISRSFVAVERTLGRLEAAGRHAGPKPD